MVNVKGILLVISLGCFITNEAVARKASLAAEFSTAKTTKLKERLMGIALAATMLSGVIVQPTPSIADKSRVAGQRMSSGGFFQSNDSYDSSAFGIFLDAKYRDDPRIPKYDHAEPQDLYIAGRMAGWKVKQGGFQLDGEYQLAISGEPLEFINKKVAPLIFGHIGWQTHDHEFHAKEPNARLMEEWGGYYEDRLTRWDFAQGLLGGGLELIGDPWQKGKLAHVQLRAGVGGIVHYEERVVTHDVEANEYTFSPQQPPSRRDRVKVPSLRGSSVVHREKRNIDEFADFTGMLELTIRADRITVGELLDLNTNIWYLLPIIPHSEITARVYHPLFDKGEMDDGKLVYTLRGQTQIIGNFYFNFEYIDSPNYYKPHHKMGLRLNIF